MQVGLLTARHRSDTMDVIVDFAAEAGFDALEVDVRPGCAHLSVEMDAAEAADIVAQVRDAGLEISQMSCFLDISDADEQARQANQEALRKAVDLASASGVANVGCLAGKPCGGMSREKTITELAAPFYNEICPMAADKGVRFTMENWFATNIMHLGHWEQIFEAVPHDNFGLNFDPSHLYHQQIDYLRAVEVFKDKIFHSHAKDTEILAHKLAWLGNRDERSWWRYVIPGFGEINWGVYIARLRDNGFDGTLSIEHEDRAFGREEGFEKGLRYLRQFV
ncbi:MAG: sugar phosphate isomerase/epimerase [candidate division WS1 bacterium]|jgi:sugar phosphate isomerase/epimerase|nr:sugar phosphate isomerase/epimerase [candidate division WS1 bacterium]